MYGPTLTVHVLERAAALGIAVGFYGGMPEVLDGMQRACARRFAGLQVAYAHAPPFRQLTADEMRRLCARSTTQERGSSLWDWVAPSRSGGWHLTGDR